MAVMAPHNTTPIRHAHCSLSFSLLSKPHDVSTIKHSVVIVNLQLYHVTTQKWYNLALKLL